MRACVGASTGGGILHEAQSVDDGSWQWNYDRTKRLESDEGESSGMPEADVISEEARSPMWDDFASVACPLTLVRGSLSTVVDDADVAEAQRLQPDGCNPPSCGRRRLSCGHLAGVSLPRRRGVHFHFAGEAGRDLAVMGMHRCDRKRAQVRAKPGYPNRFPTRRHLCKHITLQDRFR